MYVLEPIVVTSEMMVSSSVPETDAPVWSSATAYAVDFRVMHEHRIWQAAVANTNVEPGTDPTKWVELGYTNRWRAFDQRLGGQVVNEGDDIIYEVFIPRTMNAIALFGLDAQFLTFTVTTPLGLVVYDQTLELTKRDDVINFWTYMYNEFTFRPDVVVNGLVIPAASTIEITISGGVLPKVSEIMIGREINLGWTLVDTSLGIVDYSRKDRDEWGGIYVIPRPVTSTVTFQAVVDTANTNQVHQVARRIANKLCVFYALEGEDPFGTTIPGIMRDYELTIATEVSYLRIEAESLAS